MTYNRPSRRARGGHGLLIRRSGHIAWDRPFRFEHVELSGLKVEPLFYIVALIIPLSSANLPSPSLPPQAGRVTCEPGSLVTRWTS